MPINEGLLHVANIPMWASMTINGNELDLTPDGKTPEPPPPTTTDELVEMFDKNVAETRAEISSASEDELVKPWTLLQNGSTLHDPLLAGLPVGAVQQIGVGDARALEHPIAVPSLRLFDALAAVGCGNAAFLDHLEQR